MSFLLVDAQDAHGTGPGSAGERAEAEEEEVEGQAEKPQLVPGAGPATGREQNREESGELRKGPKVIAQRTALDIDGSDLLASAPGITDSRDREPEDQCRHGS